MNTIPAELATTYAQFRVRAHPSGRRVLLRYVHGQPTAAVEVPAGEPAADYQNKVSRSAHALIRESSGWRDADVAAVPTTGRALRSVARDFVDSFPNYGPAAREFVDAMDRNWATFKRATRDLLAGPVVRNEIRTAAEIDHWEMRR